MSPTAREPSAHEPRASDSASLHADAGGQHCGLPYPPATRGDDKGVWHVVVVLILAIAMGLPTLGGGFVGGDDHRLVLNHVLVNHPSLAHAVELFTILHRDLYQPLPLLSFSAEFAVANLFGLFESGPEGGAWLFHLTNVLLHAVVSLLVWVVLMRLSLTSPSARGTSRTICTTAAVLFAVHPLQVEVVAWVNGRMMLLSTLFALASVLTLLRWLDKARHSDAILTVVVVLFSAISKVRAGLPLLLLIAALARGGRRCPPQKLRTRFWWVWSACVAVTGCFVLVNIQSTAAADLFEGGAEHLHGPPVVRVLLALANYFTHLVWPVGLTSYYPTPPLVAWSDSGTWVALSVVGPTVLVMAWFCVRSRTALWSTLWFFAAIADTLPFVPARNVLAADRYMHLPIVGLLWLVVSVGYAAYARWGRWVPGVALPGGGALVLTALIGMSWHVGRTYATPLRKTERIATVFPDVPRVWERLGWSYHTAGDYEKAKACAQKEFRHDIPSVRSGAYQLLGMSELTSGHAEEALRLLHRALEVDPSNLLGKYRLAMAYDELDRLREALPWYEAAVESAPMHNPTLHRLASVYRRSGRVDDARAMYEKELTNNRFEVDALLALTELDLDVGTPDALRTTEQRLRRLLAEIPDNAPARVNLGVVSYALGQTDAAIEAYSQVLSRNPREATAAVNLAQLVLAGDVARARTAASALRRVDNGSPMVQAALTFGALASARYDEALTQVDALCATNESGTEARRMLLAALERFDAQRPKIPWTFAFTAQLLIADGQIEAAKVFLELLEQHCDAPTCRERGRWLRSRMNTSAPGSP